MQITPSRREPLEARGILMNAREMWERVYYARTFERAVKRIVALNRTKLWDAFDRNRLF